ncbi:MAG: hypothetical protein QGG40_16700 [Myxococcota bacterium]|nr:hypothetical protein [Myxococcota bacterium]
MRTLWSPSLKGLFVVLLTAGCGIPTMRTAHSLDEGQVRLGMSQFATVTQLQGELLSKEGSYTLDEVTVRSPLDAEWNGVGVGGMLFNGYTVVELRYGLGQDLELGFRGLPLVAGTDLKWTVVDERDGAPVSVALNLEAGLDPYWGVFARYGMLCSSTLPITNGVQLRPVFNLYFGLGGMTWHVDLPEEFNDSKASFTWTAGGFHGPMGLEFPVRFYQSGHAITPYFSWTPWIPLEAGPYRSELRAADCEDCSAGIANLQPGFAGFAMVGVHLEPWFQPER